MFKIIGFALILFSFCSAAFGCHSKSNGYVWNQITSHAAYSQGYNYPVFVINEKMFAIQNGGWLSSDGTRWWIITIYWQGETPENLIPKQYLKSKK